ncbi:hypothetical protein P154DRAFT_519618 [Amniculicola lignicola CBS 123094]|uniref:DUF788-domain-containing protein n=1 Tax=Amniculicola lignicola CBS 123094 TaxID=1392246 RepID=A0A6A5WQ72_9PLEO|nr:hypothetical protein P154DRAFT_519618 [Amniculicola lignicola CBS 123094]
MAQKATKTLAANNTKRLNQTLLVTLLVHGFFWVLRALIYRASFSRRSLILYLLLSGPQLFIQFNFERNGRPTYGANGAVIKGGDDLEAAGLTEWMWDVTYWTYFCIFLSATLGDGAWLLWLIIPCYSAWALYTTYQTQRGAFTTDAAGVPQGQTSSKRQAKMEKRGNKVQYR